MKLAHIMACATLFGGWLPSAVLAAPMREAPKDWEVTLGAGAGMRPTFEGSDRYTVRPLPVLSVTWRDTISLGEGGLSAYWHRKQYRKWNRPAFIKCCQEQEDKGNRERKYIHSYRTGFQFLVA